MGKDVGSVITKYQGKIHEALLQWQEDANELEALLDQAESDMRELKGMVTAYKNYPGGLGFTDSQYQRMLDMMSDLGVPPSQIQGGGVNSKGYHYFTGSQYLADIKLATKYVVADMPAFQASVSSCKQAQTKDMFAVMAFYNSEKMNEESLSGLLQTLTSISQSLMQNIQ